MDYRSFAPGGSPVSPHAPLSVPPLQSPEPEKHFTSKLGASLILILLIAGTAYAGIWYWQNQQLVQEFIPAFTPRADETAGWETYSKNGWSVKYPHKWSLKDDSYIRNGQTFVFFKITSPDRFDLPSYKGVGVHYLISLAPESQVGGFAKVYVAGDQSPWNTNLGKDVIETTEEYKTGQQIISSFKFTDNTISPLPISGTGTLTGHVTIGPNCPVEREGVLCTPSPQAYTSRQVMVYKADGTTLVTTQNFDVQGNYSISLQVGTYVVKARTGISTTAQAVGTVTIKNGQTTTLNFNIDTGIR